MLASNEHVGSYCLPRYDGYIVEILAVARVPPRLVLCTVIQIGRYINASSPLVSSSFMTDITRRVQPMHGNGMVSSGSNLGNVITFGLPNDTSTAKVDGVGLEHERHAGERVVQVFCRL